MTTNLDKYSVGWNFPVPTRFGIGRLRELPQLCQDLGIKRPLLVTDPGLAGLDMIQQAIAFNNEAGIATGLFSAVQANPTGSNVDAGVAAYKAGGYDGVISFGGGSALDVGKAVAMMVGQDRPLWDFEDVGDCWTRVNEAGIAPHLAVPTTSGTGSEVGRSSVIVDEAEHKKKIIFHPKMQPWRVLADPALTVGLPPRLTGATGMDALSHSLEALSAQMFHPLADGIAIESIRLVREALPTAYAHGDDLEARAKMMVASTMGATAFQKGLGAMHAVGHAVGALFNTHHGETMAVMMPYVLELNRPFIEDKLTALARYLDLPKPGFAAVLNWVLELRSKVGIPNSLADQGVTRDRLDDLIQTAVNDPTAPSNPVKLDADSLRSLILRAIDGKLGAYSGGQSN